MGPGARLTGMISELNQSSTAPHDLKLSFHGHIGGPIILLGIMFLSNVRNIFAQQGKPAVCLCLMKHDQRTAWSRLILY